MKTLFSKDPAKGKMLVTREFAAPLQDTWNAWTQSELLDLWWAPLPWKTETKSMDFRVGGYWLYAMVGPEGERHFARADFHEIDPLNYFIATDAFADETGKILPEPPGMKWRVSFSTSENGTQVVVDITFATQKDMETIVQMGFVEGFTSAHSNLDRYFGERFRNWNQSKTSSKARVCTYLNFPGNTEQAFRFYKSVFKTEFGGKGIQRFGDIPANAGHPPVADSVKKMILHVELPITGGHVLMGTDAPKEMGFTITQGNNMHISVEPETREETKRIFEELSEGGKVSMPLNDMFWGAYFGSFTDKYGINWMLNCTAK